MSASPHVSSADRRKSLREFFSLIFTRCNKSFLKSDAFIKRYFNKMHKKKKKILTVYDSIFSFEGNRQFYIKIRNLKRAWENKNRRV